VDEEILPRQESHQDGEVLGGENEGEKGKKLKKKKGIKNKEGGKSVLRKKGVQLHSSSRAAGHSQIFQPRNRSN